SLAAFVRQLKAWDEACADGRSSCWFETEGDLPRLAGEALLAEAAATGARRIAFDAVAARLEATAAPPPPLGTALAAWPTGWGIEEGNFCGLAHWAVEVWHAAGSVDASRWQVEADGGRLFFVRGMAACRESLRALGLNQGATPAEIKTAFRMLAKTWHPDKHSGASKAAAEQRFKQIALAYETLTWGTRAQYGSASRPGYNPYQGYMDFGADTPAGEARARTERRRMQWTLGCVATFVLGLSAVTLSARRDNRRLESGELVEAYFNQ
ncbi:hypothetical protein EMIHUDRAFT_257241, partial [Emiliania huxleyi CCMP1516]|uniref:J domain-containing protein n=2 Tax=Emiliania huxleyi TaxID=2903 RepID=A0A0D3IL92_EMIH1